MSYRTRTILALSCSALVIFLSIIIIALSLASLLAAQDQHQGRDVSPMSAKANAGLGGADARFLKAAAQGGMAEVELGQLAVEKASSNDVKKFGQHMVDDHSKANDQLKQLAAQKHVDLPQGPSVKDKAIKTKLERLAGPEFDHAYMEDMVKDHKKDVAEFEKESKAASDPDIKSFASETLPTLQGHLKQAQSLAP